MKQYQERLVEVECLAALFLVHVEVLLQQVDHPVVVAGEQTDQVSEEQDEGAVDHPVVQLRAGHLGKMYY